MSLECGARVDEWDSNIWAMTARDVMLRTILKDPNNKYHKKFKEDAKSFNRLMEDLAAGKADECVPPIRSNAYPLRERPGAQKIIRICEETNCTVVEHRATGDFYLVVKSLLYLGTDKERSDPEYHTHDIAMAYIIAQRHIPAAIARRVAVYREASHDLQDWLKIMKCCRKTMADYIKAYGRRARKISAAIENEASYKGRSIMERLDWRTLIQKGLRFIEPNNETLHIRKGKKCLNITSYAENGLYDVSEYTIQRGKTVKTRDIKDISFEQVHRTIIGFFGISEGKPPSNRNAFYTRTENCPKCGSSDIEVGMISECDPRSECDCNKCEHRWIEY